MKILIIGDVMIDSYMWGKVERISPEAPIPVVAVTKKENRLGGAGNVALNVQAMGAEPILCSVIGKDSGEDLFYEIMRINNLSSEGIFSVSKRKTTVKTRVISDGQHLLRVDEELTAPLDTETEELFISKIFSVIESKPVNAIIFQDYDKGVITPYVIEKVTGIANQRGIPTTVDPKKRNFNSYKNVTLFKPNFKELLEGLKLEFEKSDTKSLLQAVGRLHETSNIQNVLVTLSEHGVFISNRKEHYKIPAEIRDIADVSGAGDTVISVATLCMAAGLPIQQTARISNLAGGLVCEKVGVVSIDKKRLLEELSA
ncbi:MAG: carbohydrate kinase [Bacteroidetes bacterium RIFOXYA12_FULL_35_11]|nr:MAG: carbohydrate kinase [Bacteroidetes bacterium GWF2_35_48]OFY77373.1 MAG: carbohydrate kinase [Bacteroidetes bacterium RIFOXYA12_FULL_35_11]OFY93842.1 MAG: carbohydrate kinase [Bacteroidetes bacterium RIFOXYC12_FULL_35_7]HBX50889.1 D-glycero-beta-D-manno-heptose-7-phosphate kinase [Bacteroidales bacterium]